MDMWRRFSGLVAVAAVAALATLAILVFRPGEVALGEDMAERVSAAAEGDDASQAAQVFIEAAAATGPDAGPEATEEIGRLLAVDPAGVLFRLSRIDFRGEALINHLRALVRQQRWLDLNRLFAASVGGGGDPSARFRFVTDPGSVIGGVAEYEHAEAAGYLIGSFRAAVDPEGRLQPGFAEATLAAVGYDAGEDGLVPLPGGAPLLAPDQLIADFDSAPHQGVRLVESVAIPPEYQMADLGAALLEIKIAAATPLLDPPPP